MNGPFKRQSQFELFPGAVPESHSKDKSFLFNRSFQFSFENLVVVGIFIIMISVVSFSFGVEKGKRMRHSLAVTPLVQAPYQKPVEEVKAPKVLEVEKDKVIAPVAVSQEVVETAKISVEIEKSVDKKVALEKIHTIQVASFKEKGRAQREADALIKDGYEAFIAPKGTYYIVCVGRFNENARAKTMEKGLKRKYSDCFVRFL